MVARKILFVVSALALALGAFAQTDTSMRFKPTLPPSVAMKVVGAYPQFSIMMPNIVSPKLNNYLPPEPLKLSNKLSDLPDSLKTAPELSVKPLVYRSESKFDFRGNPFVHDWSAGGEVLRLADGLSVVGSGSYTALPALGTMGTGSLGFRATPTERFTLGFGASGVKYHMGRSAWNDFGLYLNGSYKLTDRLSVNAFGQYYFDKRFHSVAAMGYMQSAVYGGSLDYQFSDSFSLAVGAQRYYDAYTHTWKTVPIVAPTFKIFGAPLSVDVGGLLYNIVETLINNAREGSSHHYSAPSGSWSSSPSSHFQSRRAQGGDIR